MNFFFVPCNQVPAERPGRNETMRIRLGSVSAARASPKELYCRAAWVFSLPKPKHPKFTRLVRWFNCVCSDVNPYLSSKILYWQMLSKASQLTTWGSQQRACHLSITWFHCIELSFTLCSRLSMHLHASPPRGSSYVNAFIWYENTVRPRTFTAKIMNIY